MDREEGFRVGFPSDKMPNRPNVPKRSGPSNRKRSAIGRPVYSNDGIYYVLTIYIVFPYKTYPIGVSERTILNGFIRKKETTNVRRDYGERYIIYGPISETAVLCTFREN